MFHRVPFISPTSVATVAVILALAALFALSFSSPGTAHASHSDMPEVSIVSITPEVGEEGSNLRVTLELSRALTVDEEFCYPAQSGAQPKDEVCIEGGIRVADSYNDHLTTDGAKVFDELIAFVFRGGETEKRLSVGIKDDQCITPGRTIRIAINTAFRPDTYGYTIDETKYTVPVHGDDTTNTGFVYPNGKNGNGNGEGACKAINDGEDEEVIVNRAPAFGSEPITLSVAEDTPAGEEIESPVTATDYEGDTLTYGLTGTDAVSFDINSSTGQIETLAPLDRETKSSYHLAVTVSDGKDIYGNSNSAVDDSIDVTINVTDANEAPVFDANAPTALNVVENTAAGVDIGTPVTAIDPEGDTVIYSLDDGDGAAFEIDDTSGQIKTKDALDRETKDSYTVTVTASDDGGASATHDVTITVDNEVEPPTFDEEPEQGQSNISRSIPENTLAGRPIGDPVSATDEESNPLTYSLDDQDGAAFDIDSGTGQIRTKDPLDHETKENYSVTVSVTDGLDANGSHENTPIADDTIAVTINVTDINEKPVFDATPPVEYEIAENTVADTPIGAALTATDPENDALTYTLDSGSAATFEIDANGQIKTKADLDYEAASSYTVIVQVTDSKDDNGVADTATDATITVTITVTDEDDPGSITFSSDPPIAGATLTAVLEDQDGVKSDVAVTWKWEISTDQTNWNTITDATTNSYTPGTDDTGDYLRVTATYEDELGAGKTAQTVSGAILTAPATNTNASFADLNTTRSVPENTAAGQPIGARVAAVDPDNEDTLTYSLGGTDASSFDIDTSNGQLKTKDALDFDDGQTTYSVDVSVTDSKDDYGTADTLVDDTIAVTINVTDVNEKPVFADDAVTALEVSEDTTIGVGIGGYEASDPDAGDTVTYSVSGTDAALFQVDSNGQLQVKEALDFEDNSSLTVVVSATDSKDDDGTPENAHLPDDFVAITITVTNVFEDPRFNDDNGTGDTTRAVLENTVAGQPVGAPVTATDDEGDTLTYELGGTDAASFDFDTTTGQIKTKADLDHETQETYSVTVSVSDGKADDGTTADTTMDTTIYVTIEVTDVNEAPQFDANLEIEPTIAENTDVGQPIGSPFTATDPDPADTLTYTLDSGSAATFEIDTSGQIKTKAALDHETTATYNVTVSVRDSRDDAGDTDTADDATIDVTITITDEDEPGTITLSSQQPASGETLTATLDDQDGIKTDVDVTRGWESSSDQTNWTPIDGATTNTYIPLKDDEGDYLRVTATYDDELGQGKTASAAPTNAVLPTAPTNEQPAFADDAVTTLTVLENTPAGENVGDPYTATDVDDTTLTYSLDDQDGASFEVDASGQIKTRSALDYETKDTYTVTVSVHDGKDPFGNANEVVDATIVLTIKATDMVIPAVPEQPTVNATRGAAAGLTVTWTAIAAADESPVDGYDVQYRVKDTAPWLTTNVTVTGASATITGLVYSTTYEVQVQARNSEGPSGWSPTGEGTIPARLDVTLSPGTLTVNEGSSATFTVTVSPAADRDLTISVSASSSNAESDDYSVSDTPLTFASGDTTKTFTVSTTNDSDRNDETVNLAFGQLPAAVGTGTQSTAQLTINDTTPAPRGGGGGTIPSSLSVSFGQAIYTVTEGNTSIITVNVSPAADRALSILVSATSSYAEPGDYSVSGTPLTFASGDTSKTFTVSTISDSDMDDETVNLAFGQLPAAVVAGTHPTSQLTIEDTTTAQSTNAVPEFASDATTTLFVPENTPAGENIGDPFTATDDDDTTLTYSLDDQDGASFEVDASGQIKTKSALDYETKDTYAVTVSVHDGKGPLGNANTAVDATIDVAINVGNIDIPDAPAEPTVTTTRGAAAGLTVSWTAVTATETAPVDGYDVQYRRKDATPPADWSSANVTVTGATAVITGLEYGTTYEVEVRSKNSEGESDWSPTGEGNIPSRLNVSFSPAGRTINEGSNGTFTVNVDPAADRALNIPITISSSNAESGDYSPTTTTVSFASGDTAKTFTITTTDDSDRDHETLSISFGQLPTAVGTGSQSTATLTINDTTPAPRSKSGGGGGGSNSYRRSSSQVYIPSPSNSAPIFTEGDSTHRSIAENTGSSTTIGSPVSATDADNDTLTYQLGGLDGASFSVNANSGHLLTSSVLDFEVQSSYSVYLLVSDGAGGTDRINVTIFVIDVDETPDPVPPPTEVPTPEPTPTATPQPSPTAVPTPPTAPTPTAVPPVGEHPGIEHQQRVAPPQIVDLGNATQPGVGQTTMTVIPEDLRRFRIWPIILLVLGTAMELMALGLFLKQREIDKKRIWAGY